MESNELRMFVHYQPSYCVSIPSSYVHFSNRTDHFHIHVVHIEHEGLTGMTVGQAHLLNDIISLVSPASILPKTQTDPTVL